MTLDPEHCLTCGDRAVAATVVEIDGLTAIVEADGTRETVALELVAPVVIGEEVLCHAGIALERVPPA